MTRTSILSAVMAMATFEATAIQIVDDFPDTFNEYWDSVKTGYDFGNGAGQYDQRCIRNSAERGWYNANTKACPRQRNERAKENCYAKATERYLSRKENICTNTEPIPASCDSLNGREISALRLYNDKRKFQHNLRRTKHEATEELTFDLDLACQARVRVQAIKD